jgi:hypothetical protein
MCVYIYTYIYTYMHTYVAHLRSIFRSKTWQIPTYRYVCACVYIHTCIHTCIHMSVLAAHLRSISRSKTGQIPTYRSHQSGMLYLFLSHARARQIWIYVPSKHGMLNVQVHSKFGASIWQNWREYVANLARVLLLETKYQLCV